ncbi:MAG: hypothetical protein PHC28_11620 [Flavobacterium sp.]|uniref:hypothetical protein n=1 Tax=Flavobacterium sp. TaxID=239 RepID=UPI00261D0186|nr:hypothetical protein [Flavobacterium sp.]MDD5151101.1 hypothetical protein [Flavobacterium sp.]
MIPTEFETTRSINDKYSRNIYEMTQGWDSDDYRFGVYEFEDTINPDTGNSYGYDITTSFDKEYNKFVDEGKYFIGCPFNIYESTYLERLENFINDNVKDLFNESHFVKTELMDTLEYNVDSILGKDIREQLNKSISRRKEFLIQRLESLGFLYKVRKNEYGKIISVGKKGIQKVIEQESALDLSDTSLNEKIIYLRLLGIYDYLSSKQPFNMSKNALATVISAITSEKATSIQSAINPIDNPSTSQKNNPLENEKKVLEIKLKLIELGFKL